MGMVQSNVLVINRTSILATLVIDRVWLLHSSLEWVCVLEEPTFLFFIIDKTFDKSLSQIMLMAILF